MAELEKKMTEIRELMREIPEDEAEKVADKTLIFMAGATAMCPKKEKRE